MLFFAEVTIFQSFYEKCFLFHLKSSFHSQDIQLFVVFSFPDSTEQMEVK